MARRGLDSAQVVAVATAIADAEGLEAMTLARVARELGVRAPSLYNHVDGHEGLRIAVATRALEQLADALGAAGVGRSGADALRAMAHAYRDVAREHPGAYRATVGRATSTDTAFRSAAERTLEVLFDALRAWDLPYEDAVHAVRGLRSALHGFVELQAAGDFALAVDADASFERLIATITAGLGVPAGASAGAVASAT